MNKTILITGSTDGIGLATAKSLLKLGHTVLLHGRSGSKLASAKKQLLEIGDEQRIFTYKADLSVIDEVKKLADTIQGEHHTLDVLINNAGVFVVPEQLSKDGLDIRFMVNSIAPYILTQQLIPILEKKSRVVNLSSAAQAPLSADELTKLSPLSDSVVYAKSKLALTMWSRQMALSLGDAGPSIIAINPKSFLGSKMVEQAYGVSGGNLQEGADILIKAVLSDEFANASGRYFDNDIGEFSAPHPDALNPEKIAVLTQTIENIIAAK